MYGSDLRMSPRFWGPTFSFFEDTDRMLDKMMTAMAPFEDHVDENGDIHLIIDMPGVRKEDASIEVKDGEVVIKGVRHRRQKTKEAEGNVAERKDGADQDTSGATTSFQYYSRFAVPRNYDAAQIKATHEHGVLNVFIPRRPESEPIKISIESAQ
eukprot:CAMPEP_0184684952 /NCGR_PEP_ID=MMETSP0312-20130426/17213_1 /TAXON_ID=31354 /ORGANISM="Compsopogon coeruleus, Strain SAG 36.94" /LENGTH=154 /DNA_ID=CAMNT_0027138613 /DNA_START=520 /DNA_END=987 /DNA_ORIENTATION=+